MAAGSTANERLAAPTVPQLASRTAASLLGGYAFVWGWNALGIVLGVWAGLTYHDAQGVAYLSAFLVWVTAFCWAFAARNLWLVWAVLGGGGAAMTLLAWIAAGALA